MIIIRKLRTVDGNSVIAADCELTDGDVVSENGKNSRSKSFYILVEDYAENRFVPGILSEEDAKLLIQLDERCRALRRARRLLEFSGNTEQGLGDKLRRRGFSGDAARFAAGQCAAEGSIDETADAVRKAELSARKGRGKSRIIAELIQKGYKREAVEEAGRYLETLDFGLICADAIRSKYRQFPADPDERRKAIAALQRLGFTSSDIKNALKSILHD